VLKNRLCYEILTPESVGVPSNSIVLGKHSGRHALALKYSELGCELGRGELDEVYRRFTALADRKKRVFDQDLLSLLPAGARAHAAR
jgi:2-isopropylmalate synthase